MPTFGDFLYTQLILRIPKPSTSFASKTVIITGASSGLGKEAAKHIICLGAEKLILGCRSISKGNKAKAEIESVTGCNPNTIEVWQVDIESPISVKDFVARATQSDGPSSVSTGGFLGRSRFNMLQAPFCHYNLPALIRVGSHSIFNAQVVGALCIVRRTALPSFPIGHRICFARRTRAWAKAVVSFLDSLTGSWGRGGRRNVLSVNNRQQLAMVRGKSGERAKVDLPATRAGA
jgi:hypothetical protein